ncbi:hypothetical protein UFOVP1138_88 [uncultured Caudovirales phage]|uniref:Uncharacterized protein n=1 Tax=uncultured Caudovirales phage TaxID=2100421 RepID=A0A6J5R0B6_9CAUD|nr:hypothetical protein UFOVP975_32 [uncultured Caudovirales phage]CAB4186345.1 hypothetical protein UFOVP1138_88 [uncultured Caudovirales phage]CAB4204470.1 hypothetical protein UFOVP1394_85 [uncultured Caudovirales phage]
MSRSRSEELYQGQLLVNKELREKYIALEMGIRDQFAMAGLAAGVFTVNKGNVEQVAKDAYMLADAMVEARRDYATNMTSSLSGRAVGYDFLEGEI